jgi:hypothetical protein
LRTFPELDVAEVVEDVVGPAVVVDVLRAVLEVVTEVFVVPEGKVSSYAATPAIRALPSSSQPPRVP